MTIIDEPKDDYRKPGFDGRIYYFATVGKYLEGIAQASLEQNYISWFRLLRGFFALVKSHVPKASKLKEEIEETYKKLNYYITTPDYMKYKNFYDLRLDKRLSDLTELLYSSAKEVLVPLGGDDDDDEEIINALMRGDKNSN